MKLSQIVSFGLFSFLLAQNLYANVCKRTPQVRDAIVEQVTDMLRFSLEEPPSCDKITRQHLADIIHLDLSQRDIVALHPGDLEGLSNLESLDMGGNKLRELPKDIFLHTPKLTELYLNDNNLSEITTSSLNGLHKNLKFLSVEYNELAVLVLEDFPRLEELHANENKMVHKISLKNLPQLKRALLKNNGLYNLDFGILALPELEHADLSYNRLVDSNVAQLKGMANLKTAILDHNSVIQFPSDLLYSGIEVLSLNSNRFTTESILPHLDDKKKSVKALFFYHSLSSPPYLEVIDKLAEHDANTFMPVCRRTPQIRDALVGLLKIPCEKITRKDLAAVNYLDLGAEHIKSLHPTDFDGLSNLEKLSLAGNELRRIPENAFDYAPNLKYLSLENNQLIELHTSSLNGLQRTLELLDVSDMKRNAPLILEGFTALKSLHANQYLHDAARKLSLKNLPVLKELYLFLNRLSDFDFGLFDLPQLEKLYLDGNDFRQIDGLEKIATLREISFAWNKIKTLPAELLTSGLERITLLNNEIDLLPEIPEDQTLSVKSLTLDGNPILKSDAPLPKWFRGLERQNCVSRSRVLLISSD